MELMLMMRPIEPSSVTSAALLMISAKPSVVAP
jgi:hypothetical protein